MAGPLQQAMLMVGGVYVSPAGFSAWGAATTWDPATIANVTLSGSNRVATNTGTSSGDQGARVAVGKSTGKWYLEVAFTTLANTGFNINTAVGIAQTSATYTQVGSATNAAIVYQLGFFNVGPTNYGTIAQRASGDVIGIAVDLVNGQIWFRVAPSGNWNGSALNNPATNVGGAPLAILTYPLAPICCFGGSSGISGNVITANFGATAFVGAIP